MLAGQLSLIVAALFTGAAGLCQCRRAARTFTPRQPRAPPPMEASLQTRVCHAGSASHHRFLVRRGGMVADRSPGLAAPSRNPRCELALHAP